LARVRERLRLTGTPAEALDRVLLRCQFADQAVIRAWETDDVTAAKVTELHSVDGDLVRLADRADTISAVALDEYVAQIDAALDRRALIVTSAAMTTPPAPPVL
jgi:hypothetical protein